MSDELVDVFFSTSLSTPEPVFDAIAAKFPLLQGMVCAIEQFCEWGRVGMWRADRYMAATVPVSRELVFLTAEFKYSVDQITKMA